MLNWEEIKQNKGIINSIDWDITPQEAFEAYQIKSINAWKQRNLEDVCYFVLSVWRGEAKVNLVRRTYRDSEDLAEAPVPEELVREAVARQGGGAPRVAHYEVDEEIKQWLRRELKT